MKKLFKKICMCAFAVVLCVSAFTFTACKDDEDKLHVMTLSVNPGIEFVVDENDKVVSVTASNDDAAYLLEKFTEFTGMTAKDAALKFIELSEEYGFVVSGSMTENTVKISISGDGATSLYNDVKSKIKDKVTNLGMTIGSMVEIDDDDLEDMVKECYQEYSDAQIDNMSDERLLELIKASRIETKDLHTYEERLSYYQERAKEVLNAKITAIKEYVDNVNGLEAITLTPLVTAIDTAYATIETAYTNIASQLNTLNTQSQEKLNEYIAEKKAYLDAVEAYRTAVEANAENVEVLKTAMVEARADAQEKQSQLVAKRAAARTQVLSLVETTIHNQMAALNTAIDTVMEKISLTAATIQAQINEQVNTLITEYKENSSSVWTE